MWPDDETPEPAAWINFNAATGERNVSFVCESELASIPLWSEPNKINPAVVKQLVEALESLLNDVGRANSMLGAVKARAALAAAKEAGL